MTVLAACLGVVALYAFNQAVDQKAINAAAAFFVFSAFGALMPYATSDRVVASAAFVPFLACAVLVPTWLSAVTTCAVMLVVQIVQQKEPHKTLFNTAQNTFATTAGIAAYTLAGGRAAVDGGEILVVALVAQFVVFFVVNSVSVAAVVSSESREPFFRLWKENTLRGFGFDVLSIPFVYVFAKLYVTYGFLSTSAAIALILIVRQLNSTNGELHRSNKELLELTVTTLEARDTYTSGHSRRVSHYSRIMGHALSLSEKQIDRLATAALLHDVGKIHEIFAPILAKPGKLTAEERAIMESHPVKGAELVRISSYLRDTFEPIRHHHEAWDGSGYPDALAAEAIPVFSRVIAIADTIDAMASDRPYRRGLSSGKIRAEIVRMGGIQFDPAMLKILFAAGTIDAVLRLACEAHPDNSSREPTYVLMANG